MTEFDSKVSRALAAFIEERQYSPTVRELMTEVGSSSFKGMHASLVRLRDAGIITWREGTNRTLRVVGEHANKGPKEGETVH